jgi:hypothetical protein
VLALVDPDQAAAVGEAMAATARSIGVPGRVIQTQITALGAAIDHSE